MFLFKRKGKWRNVNLKWDEADKITAERAEGLTKGGKKRILVVGNKGAGKSSLINQINYIHAEKDEVIASTGEGTKEKTKAFAIFPFERWNIEFVDSPPLTIERRADLQDLISGRKIIRQHEEKGNILDEAEDDIEKTRMHGVIYVCKYDDASMNSPQKVHFEIIGLMKFLEKRGMPLFVVMTQLNNIIPKLKIRETFSDMRISEAVDNIAKCLNVESDNVFPLWLRKPKTDEEKKSCQDALCITFLEEILEKMNRFLQSGTTRDTRQFMPSTLLQKEMHARNLLEILKENHRGTCFGVYKRSGNPNDLTIIGYNENLAENETISLNKYDFDVLIKHPRNINDEAVRVSLFYSEYRKSKPNIHDSDLFNECIKENSLHLWKEHSNLTIITGDFVKSVKGEHIVKPCIVFYCLSKGFIPLHEVPFPKRLLCQSGKKALETDVREGYFVLGPTTRRGDLDAYNDPICMGSSIGSESMNLSGSLGLFVDLPNNEKGFLTCCHVLFECIKSQPFEYTLSPEGGVPGVIQPGKSAFCRRNDTVCGIVEKAIFCPKIVPVSVDAALVKITERVPNSGHFVIKTTTQAREAGYSEQALPAFETGAICRSLPYADFDRPLLKSGTSSGLTRSFFKLDGAEVRIFEEGVVLGIEHQIPIVMRGQYEVLSDSMHNPFFIPGDSGAAVFLKQGNGSLTCIGMAIGKTSYGTAVVTPIGSILDALNLQDGDVTQFQ